MILSLADQNQVTIIDLDDPLTQMWPGLIKVEACVETYILCSQHPSKLGEKDVVKKINHSEIVFFG